MTDLDKNMRTLIVCFVLAMGVLTPLRFLEGKTMMNQEVKVLGETEELMEELDLSEETSEVIETDDVSNDEETAEFDPTLEIEDIILPEVGGF